MVAVSVIVPIYNSEKTLRQCVDSVLAQPVVDIELLLVDDGSTDLSKSICEEYALKDNRVKVISKKNGGVSSARNAGLANSTGFWVTFLDADDYLDLDYLMDLRKYSEQDILFCNYKNVSPKGVGYCFRCTDIEKWSLREFINSYSNNTILRGPIAKFYKKDLIGNLRFPEDMKVGEDTYFVFKYLSQCRIFSILPSSWYNVRLAEVSDDIKYSVTVDYATNSLRHLQEAFEKLRAVHLIGKNKFFTYIAYFKRVSKNDWKMRPYRWYFNKDICMLYSYVWNDLSIAQKIKLVGSFLLMR